MAMQAPTALRSHGLPENIIRAYASRGITDLYQWQADCLTADGVRDGRNLVYCAPTSGGKTLVSEILMLRRIAELKKPAIFVLPFVSIVAEKASYLQDLTQGSQISVKGLHGGSTDGLRDTFDIAVCTIEKANALVNRLIEDGSLANTGTLVVDELHLLGDGSRGYLLEVMLSKVLFLSPETQIVGLSATLPNVDEVAHWLQAVLYKSNFRPVPLQEYILVDRRLLNADGTEARRLHEDGLSDAALAADTSGIVSATWEVTKEGHSALVFCSSKFKCERLAESLAESLPVSPAEAAQASARAALLEELSKLPHPVDATLSKSLPRGITFHHAGLTTQERAIIERGYRSGALSVICATSTLAAGVNLPARRVIFQTPYMGNRILDTTQYRQMAGRAGRAGQGTLGESVLIASAKQLKEITEVITHSLPKVRSCLRNDERGLKRLLLEVLSVTPLGSGEDLIRFCESTLMTTQKATDGARSLTGDPLVDHPEIAEAVKWLLAHDMLRLHPPTCSYVATPLGRAVCASTLEPYQGHLLWQELEKARPCISLDTDLHICYLVTPADGNMSVDWPSFARVLCHLSGPERRVAERVGVRLDLVEQAKFQGRLPNSILASLDGQRLTRFFTSLVLWALLHETPTPVLLEKFALGRGNLQQLQQSASAFTHTVSIFCNKLQWYAMEALILSFQQRLSFGVKTELVPLMQIPDMDCVVARMLFEQGFTTPVTIAAARPAEILKVLRKTLPPDMPAARLPEANAKRLIDIAKASAKTMVSEKRKAARVARKRLREEASLVPSGLAQPKSPRIDNRPDARQLQSMGTAHGQMVTATSEHPNSAMVAQASSAVGHVHGVRVPATSEYPTSAVVVQTSSSVAGHVHGVRLPATSEHPYSALVHTPASAAGHVQRHYLEHKKPMPSNEQLLAPHSRILANPTLELRSSPGQPIYDTSSGSLTVGSVQDNDMVATCATPCRSQDSAIPTEISPPPTSQVSPAELGERLRRIGRRSLALEDVVAVSPQRQSVGEQHHSHRGRASMSGSKQTEPASDTPSSPNTPQMPQRFFAASAVNAFLSSGFSNCAEALLLPPLKLLTVGDNSEFIRFEEKLSTCAFLGVAVVRSIDSKEALCITFGPIESVCLSLPASIAPGLPLRELTCLWRWFGDPKRLCISSEVKELTAALLRSGCDPRCSFAEPRIAHWLMDPDDKQLPSTTELASRYKINIRSRLFPSEPLLLGTNSNAIDSALRARVISSWTDHYLSMPLMSALLQRLEAQLLTENFWGLEMPIAVVLAWMEHAGIACDSRGASSTYSNIVYKMAAIDESVRQLVGRRVLLSSGEDVGRALFEDLAMPLPRGVRFRRKNNGRIAYQSGKDLLKRLPPHSIIDQIQENRRLKHVARNIENLEQAGEPAWAEPLCEHCVANGLGRPLQASPEPVLDAALLPRVRTDFVQTGCSTGRLATASGSIPLLSLEKAFEMQNVWRPSIHEELEARRELEIGSRVMVAMATHAPPQPPTWRDGILHAIQTASCAETFPDSGGQTLAAYWVSHGWTAYADQEKAKSIRQVYVSHGAAVLSYPADVVCRLAAPISIAHNTPMISVNPRSYLVAESGCLLFCVDYSQLEVRLMAHFSKDVEFMRILKGNGDVFRHVAARWLQKPEVEVTAEERSGAKSICYGIIYGIGITKLAAELGISRSQAQEIQASFMLQFSGVADWIQTCRNRAREHGYVETLHGRRRFLPAIVSHSRDQRAQAERQAVNTTCQASAADLVKLAMLGIHEKLRSLRIHDGSTGRCRSAARLLLQIHDELLFEIEESHFDQVRDLVVSEMTGVGNLLVPLRVNWRTGRSWGELQEPPKSQP